MASNDNTLTSFFVKGIKWSGKQSFFLLIIASLMIGATISMADPWFDHYSVNSETPLEIVRHVDGGDPIQFGISVVDGSGKVQLDIYEIKYSFIDHNETVIDKEKPAEPYSEIMNLIFTMKGSEFLEERNFASGNYKFVISVDDSTSGVFFGVSQFNHNSIIMTSIFIILFGVSFLIFLILLPFTILILLINALSPVSKQKVVYSNNNPIKQKRSPKFSYSPNRNPFFDKLINSDWGWLTLALFFFVMFFVDPEGPFIFFSIVIVVSIFYGVTEREKMKDRLVMLLNHYPVTNVEFLANQLVKKKVKDVIKVLQIMILDEGLPIQLNLQNNGVNLVGKISELYSGSNRLVHLNPEVQMKNAPVSNTKLTISPQIVNTERPIIKQEEKIISQPDKTVEETQINQKDDKLPFCSGCGEKLIVKTAYCYNCGQKI